MIYPSYKFRTEKNCKSTVKELDINDEIELFTKLGVLLTGDINAIKHKAVLINKILDYDEKRCNDIIDFIDLIYKEN
ncbi:MAG: hypothetical protein KIC98_08230 [Clostridioides difficile]|nr:hypothetical protein [Clostridioides sp.]MBS5787883.1 hypothetical protein [Clostridioides difficile]